MRRNYLALILIVTVGILILPATAYEESSQSSGTSSGYNETETFSETFVYDLGGDWIFSGGQPDSSGPGFFLGSIIVEHDGNGNVVNVYPDSEGSDIDKNYVEKPDQWGQAQDYKTNSISDSDGTVENRDTQLGRGRTLPFLSKFPNPSGSGSESCGDGEESWGDEMDCPEDYGLPAEDTSPQTSLDITEWHEQSTPDGGSTIRASGGLNHDHTQVVGYCPDEDSAGSESDCMFVNEFEQEGWEYDLTDEKQDHNIDLKHNVEHNEDDDGYGHTYNIDTQAVPDLYVPGSQGEEIKKFVVEETGTEEVWTQEHHERTTGLTEDHYSSSSNQYCEGENCTNSQSVCTNINPRTEYKYKDANSKSKDVTIPNTKWTTEPSGSQDLSLKEESNHVDVTVKWEEYPEDTSVDINECTSTSTEYTSCGNSDGNGCSWTGSYHDLKTADKSYHERDEYDITITYETLDVKEVTYWSLDSDLSVAYSGQSWPSKQVLFETDYGGDWDKIIQNSGYYSWPINQNSEDQSNDPAVTTSDFKLSTSSDGHFIAERVSKTTYSADGKYGKGNGFIAIRHDINNKGTDSESKSSNFQIVGATKGLAEKDFPSDTVTLSDLESDMASRGISCPGDYITCVASVDASMDNIGSWSSPGDGSTGVSYDFVDENPFNTSKSLGVCKMYNELTPEYELDDGENVQCSYEFNNGTDTKRAACGDKPGERWHSMEGPEVNEDTFENTNEKVVKEDYEACVPKDHCVLDGKAVDEGTVANVRNPAFSDYEEDPESVDWEVCLNINDKSSYHEWGGQWYDLDDEVTNDYLTGPGSGLVSDSSDVDSNNDGVHNASDVDYYYRENPNPYHSTYNPGGGKGGLALEDDCDPDLQGCDDSTSSNNLIYSPLPDQYSYDGSSAKISTDVVRDEDHHPQSEDDDTEGPLYYGKVKKLRENSNQLEDSMDTTFSSANYDKWHDSDGSVDSADQYAYVDDLSETISNRGKSYDAGLSSALTYFQPDASSSPRTSIDDETVPKQDKVFGNSLAVVSTGSATTDQGETIASGEGYWIEPDEIKNRNSDFQADWKDLLQFNIDLTGPDSGLGFDQPSLGYDYKYPDSPRKWVVRGDIYFEGESDTGSPTEYLEKPMCGDDQREYLVEEGGESKRSAQFDGRYACVDEPTDCITFSGSGGEPTVVSEGDYINAGEPDEDFGRLKNDVELCAREDEDSTQAKFYDQDYGDIDDDGKQETCRENTLYGSSGVRWIDSGYVKDHPYSVRGGIDDDWNAWFREEWERGERTGNYTSKPEDDNWPDGKIENEDVTPVPAGSPNKSVATLGLCGGDDDGEYLVTQQCNTRLCQTDNSVIGVADTPGDCILDGSQYPQVSDTERRLYDTGDKVKFDLGDSQREIACYSGSWYEQWPIVFEKDNMEVESGETERVTFHVINIHSEEREFEVSFQNQGSSGTSVYQFSEFSFKDGDSFTTTVPAQDSKSFQVDIYGGSTEVNNEELWVQADAVNSEVSGEDNVVVDIVKDASGSSQGVRDTENVPGLGLVHVVFLMLISTLIFFSQS